MTSYMYLRQNVRSIVETCQRSHFNLSNGINDKEAHYLTYQEFSFIKYSNKGELNDQFMVYVNVIKNGHLEYESDDIASAIVAA